LLLTIHIKSRYTAAWCKPFRWR